MTLSVGCMKQVKWQKKQLGSSQRRMKSLYDRRTEKRQLMSVDQVLALLPVEGSPFQAQYTGPFVVVKQISDLNDLIATQIEGSLHSCVSLIC